MIASWFEMTLLSLPHSIRESNINIVGRVQSILERGLGSEYFNMMPCLHHVDRDLIWLFTSAGLELSPR